MMRQSLVGQQFGRGIVICEDTTWNYNRYWRLKCECGKEYLANTRDLNSGHVKSCGCLRRELMASKQTTHGMYNTPEYGVWRAMINRCKETNKNTNDYVRYFLRGIKVCDRWLTFENFFLDMGKRPTDKHSIERINNDGNYEPSNCKWATSVEQCNNRAPHYTYTQDIIKTRKERSRKNFLVWFNN